MGTIRLEAPQVLSTGQSADTQLSPNCNALATATFDFNETTNILFKFQNRVPLWASLVSTGIPQATLDADIDNGTLRLCQGLRISFNAMGGSLYTVTLDGTIIESATSYPLVGTNIGVFQKATTIRRAILSLRDSPI